MTVPKKRPSPCAIELGGKLRALRMELGMSLSRVEELSRGQYKAVVVGSWERGDRAITAEKLAELAGWYRTPVTDLLPGSALVAEAFAAITAAAEAIRVRDVADKQAELERVADSYQRELADLMASIPAEASI